MAVGVNIISQFDAKGIEKAIKEFKRLKTNTDKAAYGLRTMDAAATKFVKTAGKFAAVGGVVAGVISKSLVNSASNLQESMNKISAVFGTAGRDIIKWSETTAKSWGISQRSALEAAGTYGNLFQAFGMSAGAAREMSISLVQLAADMASFNNVPIDDALYALRAGLSGESEPLKRFGVALNDTMLKEQALAMGLIKTTKGVLPQAIKTQAAYGLILKQTSRQQGDVARTSDGLAFQLKTLGAQFEDVKAKVGTALIPAFTVFTNFMTSRVVPVLTATTDLIGSRGLGAGLEYFVGASVNAISNMGGLGKSIMLVVSAFVALKTATLTYTAVTSGLSLAAKVAQGSFAALLATVNATKVALATAGVVTAIIAAAGIAYSVYAGRKAKAVQATKDFVSALELEGDAQRSALEQLYESNENFRYVTDTMKSLGMTFNDVEQYVNSGTGAVTEYADAWAYAQEQSDAVYPQLDAMREVLGLSTDVTYSQIAAIRNMVIEYQGLRAETVRGIEAQIALAESMNDVARAAQLRARMYGVDPTIRILEGGATSAAGALDGLTDSLSKVPSGVSRAARTVESFKDRLDKVKRATESYNTANDRLADSVKSVQRAQESYARATDAVAAAQQRFQKITSGYGENSDEAKTSLLDLNAAQRAAERTGYDFEQALYAVADAEAELDRLRSSPDVTPRQLREAEIRLAEARLTVKETTDAQTKSTDELNAAQLRHDETVNGAKQGSATYRDALAELNSALVEQRDAHDAVTEAIKDQEKATNALREAEQELYEMRKKYPRAAARLDAEQGTQGPAAPVPTLPAEPALEYGSFMSAVRDMYPNSAALKSSTPVVAARAQFPKLYEQYRKAGRAMADGGIVTEPTTVLVGEAGPEAIIPLDRAGAMSQQYITININSTIADETLPNKIVQALQTYNRRVGPVRVQVRG